MNNKICGICSNMLTEKEYNYFNDNDLTFYTENIYLCSSHYCICMPDLLPWSYLTFCSICYKGVCKNCKHTINNITLCEECGNKIICNNGM